ncbi:MAG TPA: DNA-binding protein [Cytophagales bacterium]|jgi:predicted XRE-type DNA-binding protein|nr:DNA-binding protein [Cytophagales bacterium]
MSTNKRKQILDNTGYWVEKVNLDLYDAIIRFMEANKMKRKDLAEHLGISKGRVSQILNDGEINFSMEKIIDIALKLGKYPSFEFVDKDAFLRNELRVKDVQPQVLQLNINQLDCIEVEKSGSEISTSSKMVSHQLTFN